MEIRYHIGRHCNLRCSYCDVEKSIGEEKDYDYVLLEEVKKYDYIERILITGGEPTLYHERVCKILKELQKYNIGKISITSNGTNKKELLEYSKFPNVKIAISWDGHINDRGYDAYQTIKYLHDNQVEFSICMVLSNSNCLHLLDNLNSLKKIDEQLLYNVEFIFVRQKPSYYKMDLNKIEKYLFEVYKQFPNISLFKTHKKILCQHLNKDDTLIEILYGQIRKGCIPLNVDVNIGEVKKISCTDENNRCASCDINCSCCVNSLARLLPEENIYDGKYYNTHLCKFNRIIDKIIKANSKWNFYYEKLFKVEAIELIVSNNCNMACTYCFQKGTHKNKNVTMETIESIINIFKEISNNKKNIPELNLFGGEPLLAENINKLDYLLYSLDKLKIYPSIFITTNGLSLSNQNVTSFIKKYFKKFKMQFQISIDYNKEINDKYRITKQGFGTYDIVIENIKLLSSIVGKDNISTNSVLNMNHICEWIDWILFINNNLIDKYISGASFRYDQTIHHYMNNKQEKEFTELYRAIIELFLNGHLKSNLFNSLLNTHSYVCDTQKWHSNDTGCGICNTVTVIDTDGDIYPCHALLNEKSLIIGNINTKIISDKIYDIYDLFSNKGEFRSNDISCDNCKITSSCIKCKASNYLNNKNSRIVHGSACALYKKRHEIMLEYFGKECFSNNKIDTSDLKNDITSLIEYSKKIENINEKTQINREINRMSYIYYIKKINEFD